MRVRPPSNGSRRNQHLNRRALILSAAAAAGSLGTHVRVGLAQAASPSPFGYPISWSAAVPGDGFLIRHGYVTENTWYLPGFWHTGEDWYALDGLTAGAEVLAIGDGDVVFAGSDYPGRVVIVRHAADLFSMYGHLAYELMVEEGMTVRRGDPLGTVLARGDNVPDHLHFEVRNFLLTAAVNGEAPRYGFACGSLCPPGPGYWPIAAPDHPSEQGWRNPTHVINGRAFSDGETAVGTSTIVAEGAPPLIVLHASPDGAPIAGRGAELKVAPGMQFPLLAVDHGPEDTGESSADAYRLWYRIRLLDGTEPWVRAATASASDTGSDGRPSAVRFSFLISIPSAPA